MKRPHKEVVYARKNLVKGIIYICQKCDSWVLAQSLVAHAKERHNTGHVRIDESLSDAAV